MAQVFSNVSPQNKALQTKINPTPLQPWQNTLSSVKASNEKSKQVGGIKSLSSMYGSSGGMTPISPQLNTQSSPALQLNTSQSNASQSSYTPPTTQTNTQTVQQPSKDVYRSVTQDLANTQTSPYNQQVGTSAQTLQDVGQSKSPVRYDVSKLRGIAENQTPQVTQAQEDYNKFAQSSPYMLAAQHNPNVAADIASGRSSLLGQTFGAVLGAKSQAVQNALSGQGQQINAGATAGQLGLSGQAQQIGATQGAGNLALGAQTAQQSALGTAGQLATPRQSGYVMIDPLTGQPVGGTQAGMNAASLGGQYSAAESGGQAFGSANQQIIGAENNAGQLNQILTNAGVSSGDFTAWNAFKNLLNKEGASNPNYTSYVSAISAINNSLSQVLGQTIDVEELARQNNQSIQAVIQNQLQLAKAKAEGYLGNQQSGQNTQSSQSSNKPLTWDSI